MTSQPTLLENPEVALALMAAMPFAVIDQRERIVEVNAASAARLNRPVGTLLGVELQALMRGVALDEAQTEGSHCYRLAATDARSETWVRLQRTSLQSRQLVTLIDVTSEWKAL